jgi:hypothetical protein
MANAVMPKAKIAVLAVNEPTRITLADQAAVVPNLALKIVAVAKECSVHHAARDEVALKQDQKDDRIAVAKGTPDHDVAALIAIDVMLVLAPNLAYNVVNLITIGLCMDHWPATRMSSTEENPGTNRLS